jgi:hypothetical protein
MSFNCLLYRIALSGMASMHLWIEWYRMEDLDRSVGSDPGLASTTGAYLSALLGRLEKQTSDMNAVFRGRCLP